MIEKGEERGKRGVRTGGKKKESIELQKKSSFS